MLAGLLYSVLCMCDCTALLHYSRAASYIYTSLLWYPASSIDVAFSHTPFTASAIYTFHCVIQPPVCCVIQAPLLLRHPGTPLADAILLCAAALLNRRAPLLTASSICTTSYC